MSGGRFLSVDPVTTDANTGGSFTRYAYAENNPYKYIDPDGRDSFLVSRPLGGDSKIISHNYVVSHATSIGDPKALMHSFGRQTNGATGLVDKTTTGLSQGTSTKDAKHWLSLAGDKKNAAENTTKIDATDASVASAANSVLPNTIYDVIPALNATATNSNSAASAVADKAAGKEVALPKADGRTPIGAGEKNRIEFKD
jgi:hypothetical protein